MNRPAHIIICSANALIRANLAASLRDQAQVDLVASTEELAARLQVSSGGMVLLDGDMLKAAGLRRLLALAGIFPGTRMLLFNTSFDKNLLQQALEAGLWGIMTHAAALEDFTDAVRTILDDRRYFSPDIPLALMGQIHPRTRPRFTGR